MTQNTLGHRSEKSEKKAFLVQILKSRDSIMELDISLNESIPLSNDSDDEFGIS